MEWPCRQWLHALAPCSSPGLKRALCSRRHLASKSPDFCYPSLYCKHISGTTLSTFFLGNRSHLLLTIGQILARVEGSLGRSHRWERRSKVDLTISCRQTRDGSQVSLQSSSLLPPVPAQSNTAGYECGVGSGPDDVSHPLSLCLLLCPYSCVSPAPGPSHPAAASPLPWVVPPTMTVAWRCRGRGQGVWET